MIIQLAAGPLGYALKVIACSGLFFCFYRIVLAAKPIYQWNRLMLICIIPLSTLIPLLSVPLLPAHASALSGTTMAIPQRESFGIFHEHPGGPVSGDSYLPDLLPLVLVVASIVMLTGLIASLFRIRRLIGGGFVRKPGYRLVMTTEKDAPFSFFDFIFWNEAMPIDSIEGQRILHHELIHVRQCHSADKLFINLMGVICWWKPFYWLSRRELYLVHEFICDAQTHAPGDTAALSGMLLATLFPGRPFTITNNFYSSTIKRRIFMLSNSSPFNHSALLRLASVAVILTLLAAFTLDHKSPPGNTRLLKPHIIVIDAGHGGTDPGAVSPNGIVEKDLCLQIAKEIAAANHDANLQVILTRSDDSRPELRSRVDFAVTHKADAFISIHLDNAAPDSVGMKYYLSRHTTAQSDRSAKLGLSIASALQKRYAGEIPSRVRSAQGIWVLDSDQITYPAILLSCGNLQSAADLTRLTDPQQRQQIVSGVLNGVQSFLSAN